MAEILRRKTPTVKIGNVRVGWEVPVVVQSMTNTDTADIPGTMKVDVVGPVCESSDCFAKNRSVQEVGEGEYLAIMSAGAYGHVMASRYNTRSIPAEVLVKGSAFEQVNARETFEQQIANEKIPAFLK